MGAGRCARNYLPRAVHLQRMSHAPTALQILGVVVLVGVCAAVNLLLGFAALGLALISAGILLDAPVRRDSRGTAT
jgi:multisubunit Na+/H+ antiporter MnhG subunit